MKKILLFILLVFYFISCTKKVGKNKLAIKKELIPFEQKVFPQQNIDSTIIFSLDTIKTFNKLEKIVCEDKQNRTSFFRVKNKDIRVCIKPFTSCSKSVCILIRENNIITITDSVYSNKIRLKFNINNYKKVLQRQFVNRGEKSFLSKKPDRVVTYFLRNQEKFITNEDLNIVSEAYISFLKDFNLKNIDSLKKVYPLHLMFFNPPPVPPHPDLQH